jgi:hypothetical protein
VAFGGGCKQESVLSKKCLKRFVVSRHGVMRRRQAGFSRRRTISRIGCRKKILSDFAQAKACATGVLGNFCLKRFPFVFVMLACQLGENKKAHGTFRNAIPHPQMGETRGFEPEPDAVRRTAVAMD